MELIVRKYGGTSVESIDKIKKIAQKTKNDIQNNKKILLVVSAMGKSTDDLLNKAKQISGSTDRRELDLLMSSGEIISSTLMSIALQDIGVKAKSLTGFQAGIDTNSSFGKAESDHDRLISLLVHATISIVMECKLVSKLRIWHTSRSGELNVRYRHVLFCFIGTMGLLHIVCTAYRAAYKQAPCSSGSLGDMLVVTNHVVWHFVSENINKL